MPLLAQLVDDVVVNRFAIDKPSLRIGRHPDNDIQIDDLSVSGHHAAIVVEQDRYLEGANNVFVEDLNSTNGTFVNDQRVQGRRQLSNNDVVRIAWNSFKFIEESESTLEQTAHNLQL